MEILVDLHTHTVSSGHAYSTITENALAASRKGLKLLGMTDHGPSMPGAPHLYHFGNFSIIPEEISGVKILPGVEANIINHEGELDIPFCYLAQMKLVLVGLHVICYPGGTSEQNTQAYIKAMENPYADMMVHPGRPDFQLDLERIAYTSAKLKFVFVGDGPYAKSMKECSYDNVVFRGYLKDRELSEMYASSDVFVFPSSTETFGNVVLEAMASGLPVIAVNSGGVKESVVNEYNGLMCTPRDSGSFAQAIIRLIEDKKLKETLAANAREHLMTKSWSRIFDKLVLDYYSVLERSSRQLSITA